MDRELNTDYKSMLAQDVSTTEALAKLNAENIEGSKPVAPPKRNYEFGDKGSNWRMMKLRRVHEIADEESRSIEDVAVERFGSIEAFEDAKEERAFLDGKAPHDSSFPSSDRKPKSSSSKFMLPQQVQHQKEKKVIESPGVSRQALHSLPSAVVPAAANDGVLFLSTDELNKLNAKLMKAKLMGLANVKELEEKYNKEKARAEAARESDVGFFLREIRNVFDSLSRIE
jgi:hypothetical protein